MFGRGKKTVSLAYKENLLAQIAHYDKRIEEALSKPKQNSFVDQSFSEDVRNPYKFSIQPSQSELKRQEANLSERASMTLELAMLTIMQSEVNVMVTPPDVRKPVQEDGMWQEVVAECKIDLVSFTISFYAHKPYRKFAPTRYRNVAVSLVKPAHEKELAQSILPKLKVPNLALQVLQSYATAFRSRRTTLLELAETYADKLNMQAMPGGGYRVRFLALLQVEWTLENLWSPLVPFAHRMKFELEYMPKEYISAIGKLYKQFKDPSLETKDRTLVLSKIFDICLQAAPAPAREPQDSFESDPETAGSHHGRRTTIDQEPDVPHVDFSPKKPSVKENKHQNRKTNMAPPNAIPKKSKKVDKNKGTEKIFDNRKSVKRTTDNNGNKNAKKSKNDESNIDNGKGTAGLKGGSNAQDKESETGTIVERKNTGKESTIYANAEKNGIGSKNKMNKKSKVPANNSKGADKGPVSAEDHSSKKTDGKVVKAKTASCETNYVMTNTAIKNKDGNSKNTGDASSKRSKEGLVKTNGQTIDMTKDTNSESKDARPKKVAQDKAKTKKDKIIERDNGVPKDTEIKVNVVKSKAAKATSSKMSVKNTEEPKDTNNKNNEVTSISAETRVITKSAIMKVDNTKKNEVILVSAETKVSSKNGTMQVDNTKKNEVISISAETRVSTKSSTMKVDNTKNNEVNIDGSKRVTKKDGEGEQVVAKGKNAGSDVGVSNTRKTFTKHNDSEEPTMKINDTATVTKTSSKTDNSKGNYDKIQASKNVIEKDIAISKKVANDIEEKVIIGGEVGQNKKVVHKAKNDAPKTMASQNANKKKVLKKTSDKDLKENKGNTGTKLGKAAEKPKVIREKTSETVHDNNEEKNITGKSNMNHKTAERKFAQDVNKKTTKAARSDAQENNSDEILAKKRKTTEPDMITKKAKNDQSKKPVADKTEKYTGNSNPTENVKVLKVTNGDTLQKAVENNKQNKTVTNKTLNVTITKPKIIPISKIPVEKQIKIADKLKTKIPVMNSKMTLASLGNKLAMNKVTTMAEKTKIPLKNLPVFKELSSNLPTRASPRKLPIFAQSSRGFLNK